MTGPSDVVSIIDSWPSLGDFARDAGVSYGAAKQMRRRKSIPVDYWPALISSEVGANHRISADLLMGLHALGRAFETPAPAPTPRRRDGPVATDGPEPFDRAALASLIEGQVVDRDELAWRHNMSLDRLEDIVAGRTQPSADERAYFERQIAAAASLTEGQAA